MQDPENPSPETQERWRKDPNNWIWGLFLLQQRRQTFAAAKKKPYNGFYHQFCQSKFGVVFCNYDAVFSNDCISYHKQKIIIPPL